MIEKPSCSCFRRDGVVGEDGGVSATALADSDADTDGAVWGNK